MKFIHIANTLFSLERSGDDFFRLLDFCKENGVQVLFITGNVFDGVPDVSVLQGLDEKLAENPELRTFLLRGMADGKTEDFPQYSFKSNTILAPADCIQRVFIARYGAEITAVSYDEKTWRKVNVSLMKPGSKGALQILLLPQLGASDEKMECLPEGTELPFDYVGIGQKEALHGIAPKKVYSPGIFSAKEAQMEMPYIIGELSDNEIPKISFGKLQKPVSEEGLLTAALLDRAISEKESRGKAEETAEEEMKTPAEEAAKKGNVSLPEAGEGNVSGPETEKMPEETAAEPEEEPVRFEGTEAEVRFLQALQKHKADGNFDRAREYGMTAIRAAEKEE